MSYNGIGLTTVRGSGTNGYVQRNLAAVRKIREKIGISSDDQGNLDSRYDFCQPWLLGIVRNNLTIIDLRMNRIFTDTSLLEKTDNFCSLHYTTNCSSLGFIYSNCDFATFNL